MTGNCIILNAEQKKYLLDKWFPEAEDLECFWEWYMPSNRDFITSLEMKLHESDNMLKSTWPWVDLYWDEILVTSIRVDGDCAEQYDKLKELGE